MSHHESNGHGHSHDHDHTEGSRQYYPKGWYLPLIGLAVIALGITFLAGSVLGISGTDKWGKTTEATEQHDGHGGHDEGTHHEGDAKTNEEKKHEEAPAKHEDAAPAVVDTTHPAAAPAHDGEHH